MTSSRFKSITLMFLLGIMLLILLCSLYMYFSHDVEGLKHFYPHRKINKNSVTFILKKDIPKRWASLNEISPFAKSAIVLTEDWSFYQHQGVDINQIRLALFEMLEINRFRGASTITQQMVKNIFLYEDKTLWRKLHEFILTQKVEQVISKDRILEIYLNCIEFGPGIHGIQAAAYHFFNKPPSELGPKESAFLAMLLPSPKRYYRSFRQKKLTDFARTRVDEILVKMRMGKVLTPSQYEAEKNLSLSWEK